MDDLISRADALAVVMHSKDPVKDIQALPGVGWIPVTERVPQEDEPLGAISDIVQVLLDDGLVTVGWCSRGLRMWFHLPRNRAHFEGMAYDCSPVVAWQPLAEPPEEGE